MIAKLLPVLLLLVGIGAGIGAGIALAPPPEEVEFAEGQENVADTEDPAEEEAESEDVLPNDFIKINNQFVIPVVERDQLSALVVMSLTLEAKPGMSGKVHSFEPKLRDAFLQILFDHANMGGFRGAFTRSEVLDPLRTALREEGRRYLGNDLVDVVILELTRQDV